MIQKPRDCRASTAPVHPATNKVGPEGRAFSHEVEVAAGVSFLEGLKFEGTEDCKPPDLLLAEDEVPLVHGAAAALPRREGPPPMSEGQSEETAAAKGRLAPPGRRRQGPPRPQPAWRTSTLPAGSAARKRTVDKLTYRDLLARKEENVKLERQCLLAQQKASEEQLRAAKATREAAEEVRKTAIFFTEQGKRLFALLGQAAPQESP
ncbi:hypothetical protein ISCGN_023743 [Ixodes scapularis]